jgi:hypothetical protein
LVSLLQGGKARLGGEYVEATSTPQPADLKVTLSAP